jgi:hypothetical protein
MVFEKEGSEWGEPVWEGDAKVILFVRGEYASCNSTGNRSTSTGTAPVGWDGKELGSFICKGYRFWSWLF